MIPTDPRTLACELVYEFGARAASLPIRDMVGPEGSLMTKVEEGVLRTMIKGALRLTARHLGVGKGRRHRDGKKKAAPTLVKAEQDEMIRLYNQDYSLQALAEIFKVTYNTVKQVIQNARTQGRVA